MDERLPDPDFFRQGTFKLASRLAGVGDIRATPEQLAGFRAFADHEDARADALVTLLRQRPHTRKLFDQALEDGIDSIHRPPKALRDFFTNAEATPYWVDHARIERGARAITRTGLLGLFPLGDMSLMGGYLASRATKPLVATGEIEHMASRRLVETAAWWIDVTTPGNLRRHAKGYQATLRVRLVHAYVRDAMNRRQDWDYDAWDRPINQLQTVGTLLLFSLVFVLGTQFLGIRYTERERADIIHLWRYVGWLLGIDEELLPATEEDAWRLLWLLATTEFVPDEDSRRLAKALLLTHEGVGIGRGAFGKVLAHVSVRVHASISRLVLGRTNADFLELPDDPLAQGAVLAAAAVNFAAETVRRHVPGATTVQEVIGRLERRRYVTRLSKIFDLDPAYTRHMHAA